MATLETVGFPKNTPHGQYQVQKLSMPEGYNDTYIDFDGIP